MTATTSKNLVFEKRQVNKYFKGKGGVFDYLISLWDNYDRFWQEKDPEKKYWTMWDVAAIEALAKPNLCQKKKVKGMVRCSALLMRACLLMKINQWICTPLYIYTTMVHG